MLGEQNTNPQTQITEYKLVLYKSNAVKLVL